MAKKTKKDRIKEFLSYIGVDGEDVNDYSQLEELLTKSDVFVKVFISEDGSWVRVGDKVSKKVDKKSTIHKVLEAVVNELT